MRLHNRVFRLAQLAILLSAGFVFESALTSGCGSGKAWLDRLSVTPGVSSIALGESARFIAQATYSDGHVTDVTASVLWTSSDPGVAALNTAGTFTPKSVGTTTVIASLSGVSCAASLTVTPAALTGIKVEGPSSPLFVGMSSQLRATGAFTDKSTADITNQVEWTAAQPAILAVSEGGMAKAQAAGTAQVTASLDGLSASASVTVSLASLSGITVVAKTSTLPLGTTQQLAAMGAYTDGSTADLTAKAVWTSSSPATIAVRGAGMVQAAGTGQASVVAAYSGLSGSVQLKVSPAALASIAVTAAHPSLPLGSTEPLKAIGTFTDSSTQDLTPSATWTSSAPGTLSVTGPGSVTARAQGTATVSASASGISGSAGVTVGPAALVSLAVTASRESLPLGTSGQLQASGAYTDGSTADLTTKAAWTSSSPATITVSSSGIANALAVGSASVKAAFGGLSATETLTVSAAALTSIAVTASQSSLPLGSAQQLKALGTYTDSSTKDITSAATWTSSSPATLSLTGPGLVSAKSMGGAIVTASSSGISGSVSLSVGKAALVSLNVSAGRTTFPLGTSAQLSAIGTYTDGTTQDLTPLAIWSSSSPSVLSVGHSGYVVAVALGSGVVSASDAKISGKVNLSVTAATPSAIAVSPGNSTLAAGQTAKLSAIETFTDGTTQDITQSAVWASSSSKIVNISAPGTVVAATSGTAMVTATSSSFSGVSIINVPDPALTSLAIAPAQPALPLGGNLQLTVTGYHSDGSAYDVTSQATWTIDNQFVAAIAPGGMATGLQVGTTMIHASVNSLETSVMLTVEPVLSVSYFDASSGADSTIRATNPDAGNGDVCSMIYVFNQNQQMSECCGCRISPDGLLTLSLTGNLLSNPLTGVAPSAGTVVLVSGQPGTGGTCDAASLTPAGSITAWLAQLPASAADSALSLDHPFSTSPLTPTDTAAFQAQCSFIQQLGSGQGACSCAGGVEP